MIYSKYFVDLLSGERSLPFGILISFSLHLQDSKEEVISCRVMRLVMYGSLLHRMAREENLKIIDNGLRCFIFPTICSSK